MDELAIIGKSNSLLEWEAKGVNLGTIDRHVQFYIGDWLLEGWDSGYIKRGVYDRASELTGIEKIELQKYVSICKSIESLRRRKELPYSHHYEVAKLKAEDQEYFLNKAVENHWSVSALRDAIKQKEIEDAENERDEEKKAKAPAIYTESCDKFLKRFEPKSIDLLFTDPPYSTDLDSLPDFLDTWLLDAIDKIKDTGRAFICIGAYPVELYTYLGYLLQTDWIAITETNQIISIASRIQWDIDYRTFTIRYERWTGSKTEYDKRIEAIKNEYTYPTYTLQAYFKDKNKPQMLSCGIVKTSDLYSFINFFPELVYKNKSDNIFKYVKWDDILNNSIRLHIFY